MKIILIIFFIVQLGLQQLLAQFRPNECIPQNGTFLGKARIYIDTLAFVNFGAGPNDISFVKDCLPFTFIEAIDIDDGKNIYVLNMKDVIKIGKYNKIFWRKKFPYSSILDMKYFNKKVYLYVKKFDLERRVDDFFIIIINSKDGSIISEKDVSKYVVRFNAAAGGKFFYGNNLMLERIDYMKIGEYVPIYILKTDSIEQHWRNTLINVIFTNSKTCDKNFLFNLFENKSNNRLFYAGQNDKYVIYRYSCSSLIAKQDCGDKNIIEWWLLNKNTNECFFLGDEDKFGALSFIESELFRPLSDNSFIFLRNVFDDKYIPQKALFMVLTIKSQ